MTRKVSCIVPVHDGETYLGEALESVLSQTRPPDEVIVVDDGSSDSSASVAAGFGARVQVLRRSHTGAAASRNAGIQAASGDLIAQLDADDLWLPRKLERQLAHLACRPGLDVCLTRFQNFWSPELRAEGERYREHPLASPSSAYCLGTALIRRDCFERFGGFDPARSRVCGMIWFLEATSRGATLETLPEVLMRRRYHGRNSTRTENAEYRDAFLHVVKAWLDSRRRRERRAPSTTG